MFSVDGEKVKNKHSTHFTSESVPSSVQCAIMSLELKPSVGELKKRLHFTLLAFYQRLLATGKCSFKIDFTLILFEFLNRVNLLNLFAKQRNNHTNKNHL